MSMMIGSAAQQPGNLTGSRVAKSARNSPQEITLPQYPLRKVIPDLRIMPSASADLPENLKHNLPEA